MGLGDCQVPYLSAQLASISKNFLKKSDAL